MPWRCGKLTQESISGGDIDQFDQIIGAGLVFTGQTSGINVVGIAHANRSGFRIHQGHENRQATWVAAPECMRGPIFAGHQCQVQQFSAAQFCSDAQARRASLLGIHIGLGNHDFFVHGQFSLINHQTGHQLGQ